MAHSAERLEADLRRLGVAEGGVLMVHASLSALGRVEGGAPTAVAALRAALGPEGTLAVPAFREALSLPGRHRFVPEPVKDRARQIAARRRGAGNPVSTGAIPAAVIALPEALESPHPDCAVAAIGPRAAWLTGEHPLDWGTGLASPYGRLIEADAQMLLLGVGFNRLSLLHTAEGLVPHGRRKTRLVALESGEVRLAAEVGDDLDVHFPEIGQRCRAAGLIASGRVGAAEASLMRAQPVLALAKTYLAEALVPEGD